MPQKRKEKILQQSTFLAESVGGVLNVADSLMQEVACSFFFPLIRNIECHIILCNFAASIYRLLILWRPLFPFLANLMIPFWSSQKKY
jgi:hypothetical protein